jgi:hypothetical protein
VFAEHRADGDVEVAAEAAPAARLRQRVRRRQVHDVLDEARPSHARDAVHAARRLGAVVGPREEVLGERQRPIVGAQPERARRQPHAAIDDVVAQRGEQPVARRLVAARAQLAEQAIAAVVARVAAEFEQFVGGQVGEFGIAFAAHRRGGAVGVLARAAQPHRPRARRQVDRQGEAPVVPAGDADAARGRVRRVVGDERAHRRRAERPPAGERLGDERSAGRAGALEQRRGRQVERHRQFGVAARPRFELRLAARIVEHAREQVGVRGRAVDQRAPHAATVAALQLAEAGRRIGERNGGHGTAA